MISTDHVPLAALPLLHVVSALLATAASAVVIVCARCGDRGGRLRQLCQPAHSAALAALVVLLVSGGALAMLPHRAVCTAAAAGGLVTGDSLCLSPRLVGTFALALGLFVLPQMSPPARLDPARRLHFWRNRIARAAVTATRLVGWCLVSVLAADVVGLSPPAANVGLLAGTGWLVCLAACLASGRPAQPPHGAERPRTAALLMVAGTQAGPRPSPATRRVGSAFMDDASDRAARASDADDTLDATPGHDAITAAISDVRPVVLGAAALSLLINLLMMTGPLFMLQVYDRVLSSRSRETLVLLTLLLIGLYIVLGAIDVVRARVLSRIAIKVDRHLAAPLHRAAVSSPTAHGQPLRDLEQVRQFVGGPAPAALLDLPFTPLYFALVFLLHPLLGALAVAGTLVLAVLAVANQRLSRPALAAAHEEIAWGHAFVEAGRRNVETLRAMGMTRQHALRFLTRHRHALSRQLQASDAASTFTVVTRIGRLLLQSLMLALGAWLALADMVSAGAMIAASIIATRAMAPIEQLIAQGQSLSAARAAWSRCKAALAEQGARPQGVRLPDPTGALDVANLYVGPPGGTHPILKGLTFRLSPGDGLAVIGASASGKSTLARALVGAWPIRHGHIRLDGAALEQWDANALGRHIGYLPQDVSLFDGTIAENIARLATTIDSQAVIDASVAAGVHEMILRLADGYATAMGEGGTMLSGGQRQRIALARALYGRPALVVMDEPNASLDSDGEAALVEAIHAMRAAGVTVVIMAHRQRVLSAASHVLVLKDGHQSAFGPKDTVLKSAAPKTGARAPTLKVTTDAREHARQLVASRQAG